MKARTLRSVLLCLTVIVIAVGVVYSGLAANQSEADTKDAPGEAAKTIPLLPTVAAVGKAHFPHDFHIEELEIECVECHHETSAGELDVPHEEYFTDFWIDCESCHASGNGEPQSCSNCHHTQLSDIANETLSTKVVIHKNCWTCHDMGTGVDASEGCTICHEDMSMGVLDSEPEHG